MPTLNYTNIRTYLKYRLKIRVISLKYCKILFPTTLYINSPLISQVASFQTKKNVSTKHTKD